MATETAGITTASGGLGEITWTILGQTYVPKSLTEHSFAWHATFPPGTFVPPHRHSSQNEYLYILGGRLDFWLDGREVQATAGDTVRLPMGEPHGIFNRSSETATALFWVAPTGRLYDLFVGIDRMAEQTPEKIVALAAEHEVFFLPPPA